MSNVNDSQEEHNEVDVFENKNKTYFDLLRLAVIYLALSMLKVGKYFHTSYYVFRWHIEIDLKFTKIGTYNALRTALRTAQFKSTNNAVRINKRSFLLLLFFVLFSSSSKNKTYKLKNTYFNLI